MPRKKRSPEQVEQAIRSQHALELKRDGRSYAEIGEALHVTKSAAFKIVQKAISRIDEEEAKEVRKIELLRLDGMWRRAARVLDRLDDDFDVMTEHDRYLVQSIAKMSLVQLHVMRRRAAICGTDAPRAAPMVQVNLNAPRPRPNMSSFTLDELRTFRKLQAKALDQPLLTIEAESTNGDSDEPSRAAPERSTGGAND